jgi:hypothetical protein
MTNNVYPPTCRLIYWVALLSDQPTTALGAADAAGFAAGIWAKEQMFWITQGEPDGLPPKTG